jgi:predicted Zn-dependent protease
MRKLVGINFTIFLSMILIFIECSKVPVTGRSQLNLLPEGDVLALANQQYQDFMKQHPPVKGTSEAERVNRVGQRIANAVQKYFEQQGDMDRLKGYNWEFNLVQDNQINAFAMPGGKTVVYTGIIPVAQNDAGLAVVMGHEIAHAIAKHGNERMSQALTAELGGAALSVALRNKPQQTQELFLASFGLGSQVGILLPYSRLQETEADKLGLVFMAMAGYDPHEAVGFWQRMAAASGGGRQPEFLSTHPAPENRINSINNYMNEAMKYYQPGTSAR